MSINDDLMNAIRREVERQLSGRYNTRTGLVTSYDKDTHSAKVMLKPDDVPTGWIPIHTGHIGNGWGVAIGLTPGDGKSTGDQVEVTFAEGDLEQGRIIHRLHSDQDRPPKAEAGEMIFQHEKAGTLKFDKDQNMIWTGANSQTITSDKDGNLTVKGKNGNQCVVGKDGDCTLLDSNSSGGTGGVVYVKGGKTYLGSKTATALVSTVSGPASSTYAQT